MSRLKALPQRYLVIPLPRIAVRTVKVRREKGVKRGRSIECIVDNDVDRHVGEQSHGFLRNIVRAEKRVIDLRRNRQSALRFAIDWIGAELNRQWASRGPVLIITTGIG